MITHDVAVAASALRRGELVAFPTETVYGLGADASSPTAVAALYAVKRRPANHPVIVHIADPERLERVALIESDLAPRLAAECWPGPLTIVLRRRAEAVDARVAGGRDTVGVRVPSHPVARELLAAVDFGVAAPSANRFGRVSPTTAAHVAADLGSDVSVVLDGGACAVGIESTIVDVTDPARVRILRLGGVDVATIERVVGVRVEIVDSGEVAAPGTLASHYAPDAAIVIVTANELGTAIDAARAELSPSAVGVLALAEVASAVTGVTVLATPASVDDYAHVLYAVFREADRLGLERILVVPPDGEGLAAAVRDRVVRAASRAKSGR